MAAAAAMLTDEINALDDMGRYTLGKAINAKEGITLKEVFALLAVIEAAAQEIKR